MFKQLKAYVSTPLYLALGSCFLILSILFALWITRIPEIKEYLHLSEGDLGTALFFTPLGALISMLLSTKIISKLGEGRSSVIALMFYSLAMCLPFLAHSFSLLCGTLFITGLTMGWVDISINAVANTIEKQQKVKIMNTSHGFWSLGGIVGGLIGGLTASMFIDGFCQMVAAAMVSIFILLIGVRPFLNAIQDEENSTKGKRLVLPSGELWILAIIAFCILLSEGAVVDWSTVFLKETLGAKVATAGFGYAIFSAAMTLGRFNGDYLTNRLGAKKLMNYGLVIAIIGFSFLLLENIPLSLLGFAIIGFGYSTVVPILFAESARKSKKSPALGLASVATLGYTGFLLGPVIMGWIAEWQSLTFSFGMLLLITVIALITHLKS